jgi:hypothetical protein
MVDEKRKALLESMLILPRTELEGLHFISSLEREKREALCIAENTEAFVGSMLSGLREEDEESFGMVLNSDLREADSHHKQCVSAWRSVDAYVKHIARNRTEPAPNREEIVRHVKFKLELHIACLEEEIERNRISLEEMQAEFSQMEPSEDDFDNGRFRLWDAIDLAEKARDRMRLVFPLLWSALREFVETEYTQSLFTPAELNLIKSDDESGYRELLLSREQWRSADLESPRGSREWNCIKTFHDFGEASSFARGLAEELCIEVLLRPCIEENLYDGRSKLRPWGAFVSAIDFEQMEERWIGQEFGARAQRWSDIGDE